MFVSLLSYSFSVYQFQKHNRQVSMTSTDISKYVISVATLPSVGSLFHFHCYLAAKCCKMSGFQEDVREVDTFMQNLMCPGSFRNRICVYVCVCVCVCVCVSFEKLATFKYLGTACKMN
jgi:hypothetical protein